MPLTLPMDHVDQTMSTNYEIQNLKSKIQNLEEREDIAELARVLEAVLFTAPEPLALDALRKGLGVQAARLEAGLARLASDLQAGGRGLRLLRHESTVQLV